MSRISSRAIGKYALLEQLATTGLASVYHARDTSDGTVYGFDAATGQQKWKVPVQESITTPAVLVDGTLYVSTTAGNLCTIR